MRIKSELKTLKEQDVWSFVLFALFKLKDTPEYSSISELAYILDKKNMLKLCEYFGGCTITIPTVEELEVVVCALLLYSYVDIENIDMTDALKMLTPDGASIRDIKSAYKKVKEVLKDYSISPRGKK